MRITIVKLSTSLQTQRHSVGRGVGVGVGCGCGCGGGGVGVELLTPPRQTSWSDTAWPGSCGVGTRFRSAGGSCHSVTSTRLFHSERIHVGVIRVWLQPEMPGLCKERHRGKQIKGIQCFAPPSTLIRTSQVLHPLNGHWC